MQIHPELELKLKLLRVPEWGIFHRRIWRAPLASFALMDRQRVQPVEIIGGLLRVAGGGEDRPLVVLQDFQP